MPAPVRRGVAFGQTSLSVTSPSATAIGDLVVCCFFEQVDNGIPNHTLQSGFTQIVTHGHNDGANDARLSVAYKVATAAGAQSYQPYTTDSGKTEYHVACIVYETGTYDVSSLPPAATVSDTAGANPPNPPNLTGLNSSDTYAIIALGCVHTGGTADEEQLTAPSGYTLRVEASGTVDAEEALADRNTALTGATSEDPGAFGNYFAQEGTVGATIAIKGSAVTSKQDTDPLALRLGDAATALGIFLTQLDRVALRLGDDALGISGTTLTADVLGIRTVETPLVGVTLSDVERLALRVSEASPVQVMQAVADALALRLEEASSPVAVALAIAELLALRLEETSLIAATLATADALALRLDETTSPIDVAVRVAEALALRLEDLGVVGEGGIVAILAADLLGVRVEATEEIQALFAAGDPLGLKLDDAAVMISGSAIGADLLGLLLGDAATTLLITVAVAEALALRLDDTAATVAAVLADADSLGVRLDEAASILALVLVVDLDALGLGLGETALAYWTAVGMDVLGLRTAETSAALLVTVQIGDTAGVALTDAANLAVSLAAVLDSLALRLAEDQGAATAFQDTDQLRLALLEDGSFIGAANIVVADLLGLGLQDGAVGVVVALPSGDLLGLRLGEAGTIFATATIPDALALTLVEAVQKFLQATLADVLGVALGDDRIDLGQVSFLTVTELLGLSLQDAAGVALAVTQLDTLGLRLGDVVSIAGTAQAADLLAASLGDEAATLAVGLTVAEVLGLRLEDAGQVVAALIALERLGIHLADVAQVALSVQDTEALRLTLLEAAPAIATTFHLLANDLLSLRVEELADIVPTTMTAQGKVRIATVAARTRTTIVLPVAHEAEGLIQTTVERRRR